MADVVFVFNKDGYAGNSTTLEIGYSVALGKPIYALKFKLESTSLAIFEKEAATAMLPKKFMG